ncbi:hypothetical protein ACETAC_08690 [Aceticella autotrophica]|uniref:Copper amine oxidase-like N-terminal domain-containing protein n=1 Tax=Aceticella autotrophica TaxID=2755338 RepID=A0A975GAA7_9THEO|nr:stalk domain-containing protein [Aceticella autotrophica]QSZ26937.1 hypothetical protein ACETAC_08690 [Aceticella autotrophica]
MLISKQKTAKALIGVMLCFTVLLMPILGLAKPTYKAIFTIGSNNYTVDGTTKTMDTAAYETNGRVIVPARYLAEALNAQSYYDKDTKVVTFVKGDTTIQFTLGSKQMSVTKNGVKKTITMETAATTFDVSGNDTGRTFVPARYVAEALGYTVDWNEANHEVLVYYPDTTQPTPQPIPQLTSQPTTQPVPQIHTISQDFVWEYNNKSYCWHIEVPSDLLEYDRNITEITNKFYNSNGEEQYLQLSYMPDEIKTLVLSCSELAHGNLTSWVNEERNYIYIGCLSKYLLQVAQSDGYDNFHTAEFVQSFVGGAIPYKITETPQLPAQTLVDGGDCKDKSILLASILKNMNYEVALLHFDPLPGQQYGHMAVGIVLNDNDIPYNLGYVPYYYEYNGKKYYFMETTKPGWSLGERSLEQAAYVYPVN